MFFYFLKIVQSFHIKFFADNFGITWTITYSKNTSQLKDLLGVILSYFGDHFGAFLYLLRAVTPFLIKVCKDVPMLTALNKSFTLHPPLLEAFLGYFLVSFVVFFSIS